MFAPAQAHSAHATQYKLKLYSSSAYCDTMCPAFVAGTNLICLAASMALFVNPCGKSLVTRILFTSPEAASTTLSVTVPFTEYLRALSVYCGLGLESTRNFSVTSTARK